MVSPINGNDPVMPPNPPPPSNLTEEQLDTLDSINFDLREGLPSEDRITINAFFQATVESLLDLIDALKDADLQGDREFLVSVLNTNIDLLTRLAANRTALLENEEVFMDNLVNVAEEINDQKQVIDNKRDAYNDAVADYLDAKDTGMGIPAAETALVAAQDELNQAIIDYNSFVADYQAIVDDIDAARADAGFPPLQTTNALPIVVPLPSGELIEFDPAASPPAPVLVPPIVLNPPLAIFEGFLADEDAEIDPNDPDFDPVTEGRVPGAFDSGSEIDDDYEEAVLSFLSAQSQLNALILQINAAGEPIAPNLVNQYNTAAGNYNNALSALEDERTSLNSIVPEGSELPELNIDEEETITTTTPLPLPRADTEPPESDWTVFFEQARDNYNAEVTDFIAARDAFNAIINDINDAFNDPDFNFDDDYEALKDTYNAGLDDYNGALGNLLGERDNWNNFVSTHADGANNILFDHADGARATLPDMPADIPPPVSHVSVLEINVELNEFEVKSEGFNQEFIDTFDPDKLDINELVALGLSDRVLLSLIFLSRGKATSGIYQPTASSAGSATTSASAQGGSLASIVLGLSSPRLESALSDVNVAEAFDSLFQSVDAKPPANLAALFQNVTTNGGISAALSSTRFALKIVADFLETLSPESFPVNLASALGVSQALAAISNNGGFSEITRSELSGVGAIGGLPNDNREALFDSIGNLAAFTLVFAAAADLGNVVNKAPQLALGTLALNLSFGVSGTQLSLREAVKSIKKVLGDEQLPGFQNDLAAAFADILEAGGIPGDASKALALRLASGLLTAEDPDSMLRELAPETAQVPLTNLAVFASFSPEQSPLESLFQQAGKEGGIEAIENRLARRGFDKGLASEFVDIAGQDQSALRKIAQLQAQLGPEAAQAGFAALRDLLVASSLNQKLKGEIGQSEAQSLIKEALTSINSLDNTQDRIIKELIKEEHIEGVRKAADTVKELNRDGENDLILGRLQEPTKAMIRAASSIMGDSMLPPSTGPGLRTYPSSASREIDFRV